MVKSFIHVLNNHMLYTEDQLLKVKRRREKRQHLTIRKLSRNGLDVFTVFGYRHIILSLTRILEMKWWECRQDYSGLMRG